MCEWCIWEDWGIRHRHDTAPFRGARAADVELLEHILLDLEAEHRSHRPVVVDRKEWGAAKPEPFIAQIKSQPLVRIPMERDER